MELFVGNYVGGTAAQGPRQYHVGPDGRFLMMTEQTTDSQVVLVQHWFDELNERVPVP